MPIAGYRKFVVQRVTVPYSIYVTKYSGLTDHSRVAATARLAATPSSNSTVYILSMCAQSSARRNENNTAKELQLL